MSKSLRWPLGLCSSATIVLAGITGCTPASSQVDDAAAAPSPTPDAIAPGTATSDTPEASPPVTAESPSTNRPLSAQGQILPVTATVELGGQTIGLEVASTPQQQATGLMARETLADDRGMLFPFEPARPVNFWMKNVLIPLDMVFVYDGEIQAIAANVPPCETTPCPTYGPGTQPIDYVIELRGGLASELNLRVGDPVEVAWLELESSSDATE